MSAAVCGSKRSFFEDISPSSSPPISKRIRCSSSSSPIRLFASSLVDHLRALFPGMELELLERTLEKCNNDLDAAIKCLRELCLGYNLCTSISSEEQKTEIYYSIPNLENDGTVTSNGEAATSENYSASASLSLGGGEWVDLFVKALMSATNLDDARSRAATALATLEKSISACASAEAVQSVPKENLHLKEQIDILLRDNIILKRAVAIQHERQKEYESRNQELHQLKQLVAQYQEQIRTLQINNYALTIHLKRAQQGNSIPGRFGPDVF